MAHKKSKTFGDLCDEICYEEFKRNTMGVAVGMVGLGIDFVAEAIDKITKIDSIDVLKDIRNKVLNSDNMFKSKSFENIDYEKDNKPLTKKH